MMDVQIVKLIKNIFVMGNLHNVYNIVGIIFINLLLINSVIMENHSNQMAAQMNAKYKAVGVVR